MTTFNIPSCWRAERVIYFKYKEKEDILLINCDFEVIMIYSLEMKGDGSLSHTLKTTLKFNIVSPLKLSFN